MTDETKIHQTAGDHATQIAHARDVHIHQAPISPRLLRSFFHRTHQLRQTPLWRSPAPKPPFSPPKKPLLTSHSLRPSRTRKKPTRGKYR